MFRHFISILIASSLSLISQSCLLIETSLPKKFKISNKFTSNEQLLIIEQANRWNDFIAKNTDIKQALIFDGIDERPFDETTSLDDGINTIYIEDENIIRYSTSSTTGGNMPISAENIFISKVNIAQCITCDLSENDWFKKTILHEFGHFIGITSHFEDDPENINLFGIMSTHVNYSTDDFTEHDKKLLCLVLKCVN
jgi:hypothetical protein